MNKHERILVPRVQSDRTNEPEIDVSWWGGV